MPNSVAKLTHIIETITQEVVTHSYVRSPSKKKYLELRQSVLRLVRNAVDSTGNPKPNWSSIHKTKGKYTQSHYYNGPGYEIYVSRAYDSMCALGYLKEVKKGVYARDGKGQSFLTRYEARKKLVRLFDQEDRSLIPIVLGQEAYDNPEIIRLQMKDN